MNEWVIWWGEYKIICETNKSNLQSINVDYGLSSTFTCCFLFFGKFIH